MSPTGGAGLTGGDAPGRSPLTPAGCSIWISACDDERVTPATHPPAPAVRHAGEEFSARVRDAAWLRQWVAGVLLDGVEAQVPRIEAALGDRGDARGQRHNVKGVVEIILAIVGQLALPHPHPAAARW